jgi:hypothetical protein
MQVRTFPPWLQTTSVATQEGHRDGKEPKKDEAERQPRVSNNLLAVAILAAGPSIEETTDRSQEAGRGARRILERVIQRPESGHRQDIAGMGQNLTKVAATGVLNGAETKTQVGAERHQSAS